MKHEFIMLGKMYIYSLVLNKFILNDKLNIKWQILDNVPSIVNIFKKKIWRKTSKQLDELINIIKMFLYKWLFPWHGFFMVLGFNYSMPING
jgi:hypothetical protein